MLKLDCNGEFKEQEIAKLQIIKIRHSDGIGEQHFNLKLTSMSISKLLTTVTLSVNYYTELGARRYDKVLNIHFDVASALEFDFRPAYKTKPMEELGFQGAKQNIFNFVHLQFRLGDKVLENQSTNINPTNAPPKKADDFKFKPIREEIKDAQENVTSKNSTYSNQLSFIGNSARLVKDSKKTTLIKYDAIPSRF
jgi:hypothetical protein